MKKRKKLFWKVFPLTLLMLLLLMILAYALVYCLLPAFYRAYKEQQYQEKITEVIQQVETADTFGEEVACFTEFAQQNQISIALYDGERNVLYDYYQESAIVTDWENEAEQAEISIEVDGVENPEQILLETSYEKKGTIYELEVWIPLQPLSEAKHVIVQIYPVACVICILFSLLFAVLFSLFYVKPIRKISQMTRRMSKLEPDAEIPVTAQDEIGMLSEDINHLYKELKGTIDQLNVEIKKYSDLENRKIEFLRMISHELKNPLAAAMALIDGILYEIPPYHTDQKKYLGECREFLEHAVELVRESLTLSKKEYQETVAACNVVEMVKDIAKEYRVILQFRQIEYIEQLPDELVLYTKKNMFAKALSNIISNAVNYTPEKGNIRIYLQGSEMDGRKLLVIENTCKPISKEVQEQIFKPFYSGNTDNPYSNGLGLYIVSQVFVLLHITYTFVPSDDQSGMKFMIQID